MSDPLDDADEGPIDKGLDVAEIVKFERSEGYLAGLRKAKEIAARYAQEDKFFDHDSRHVLEEIQAEIAKAQGIEIQLQKTAKGIAFWIKHENPKEEAIAQELKKFRDFHQRLGLKKAKEIAKYHLAEDHEDKSIGFANKGNQCVNLIVWRIEQAILEGK